MRTTITPFVTGDYLAPPGSRSPGQRVPAVAYLVHHPDATLLFDTGFPFDEVTTVNEGTDDEPIPTYPRSLEAELAALGLSFEGLDLVANCHLHVDHAGGNFRLPATLPIVVQATELADAQGETEQLVTDALALDRQAYRSIDGETELLPGIVVIPTPGHTAGHQSLAVATDRGVVVLMGQAMPGATEFAAALYAMQLDAQECGPVPPYPAWLPPLMDRQPQRICFAHDLAVWEAPERPN